MSVLLEADDDDDDDDDDDEQKGVDLDSLRCFLYSSRRPREMLVDSPPRDRFRNNKQNGGSSTIAIAYTPSHPSYNCIMESLDIHPPASSAPSDPASVPKPRRRFVGSSTRPSKNGGRRPGAVMPNAIPDDILNNKELNEAIKGESVYGG
jgi:hypothetical protein